MPTLPKKLKHDAIVEAVFEVRFDPGTELPELILGRLCDPNKWPGYALTRLPIADLPHALRIADPNLIHLPLFEIKAKDEPVSLKVGTHAIFCSMLKPYAGWDRFHHVHKKMIADLFDSVTGVEARRLGLRYVNVLETELHYVKSISDLKLTVSVGSETLRDNYNLNFLKHENSSTDCLVRVATKNFTTPPLAGSGHTIADIDVFTPDAYRTKSQADIEAWLRHARDVKNEAFFSLFHEEQIEKMRES